jgi:hypothetical protein
MPAAKRQEEHAAAPAAVAEAKRKEMQLVAAAVNHCFLFVFDYGPSVSMFLCVCECCLRVCESVRDRAIVCVCVFWTVFDLNDDQCEGVREIFLALVCDS